MLRAVRTVRFGRVPASSPDIRPTRPFVSCFFDSAFSTWFRLPRLQSSFWFAVRRGHCFIPSSAHLLACSLFALPLYDCLCMTVFCLFLLIMGRGRSGYSNCCPHNLTPDRWQKMDGWMVGWNHNWRHKFTFLVVHGVLFYFHLEKNKVCWPSRPCRTWLSLLISSLNNGLCKSNIVKWCNWFVSTDVISIFHKVTGKLMLNIM